MIFSAFLAKPAVAAFLGGAKAAWLAVWGVLKLRPAVPVWLLLVLVLAGWWYAADRERRGRAEVQAKWDAREAQIREIYEASRRRGAEIRQQQQKAMKFIKVNVQKGLHDAKRKGEAVAVDVRAGRLRLRDHWTCPDVPAAGKSPGSARGGNGAADLRAEDSGALVRLGAECDARIRAAQAVVIADRLGVPPKQGD